MHIGCAYYPEARDIERVEYDARLMQEAGFTLARIGEFCWSHLEPKEGCYNFEWLHQAIDILGRNGVKTILCTPSSTAPAWMVRKYPEILIQQARGTRAYFGCRDHTCFNSEIYRDYCRRIVQKLGMEFQHCQDIAGLQIDNELGHNSFGNCHCPVCQQKFKQFLQEKYGTVDALNKAWGTTFWSQEYSDWEEIELGDMDMKFDSTLILDSLRFWDAGKRAYLENQLQILRRYFPGVPITANNVSGLSDRYQMHEKLDFSGMDFYPLTNIHGMPQTAYYSDLWRNVKPGASPWVMETATCPGSPLQNLQRFYLWHFLARGFDHIVYFHWLSHLGGYEKSHGTVLGFSGKPRARYKVFRKSITEMQSLLTAFEPLPQPSPQAAVIFDYDNHWNYCQGFWSKWGEYEKQNLTLHETLIKCGINADVISPLADFSKYKLIVLPTMPHISRKVADQLKNYIAGGGNVLATGIFGIFDGNSKLLPQAGPERLEEVFGLRVEDFVPISSTDLLHPMESREQAAPGAVVFDGKCGSRVLFGQAGGWLADCDLDGATPLLTFSNTVLKGQPLLTEHSWKKGKTWYLGTMKTDMSSLKQMFEYILAKSGLDPIPLPENVEMISRGRLHFVLNHNDHAVDFQLALKAKNLLGDFYQDGSFHLPPREVSVLDTGC